MNQPIHIAPPKQKMIRVVGPIQRMIDPAEVAAALGATPTGVVCSEGHDPLTLFAIRRELFRRLQSGQREPALTKSGPPGEVSVPVQEWDILEKLAALIAKPGFTPTARQVGSAILINAIRSLAAQLPQSPEAVTAEPTRQLAEQVAALPAE